MRGVALRLSSVIAAIETRLGWLVHASARNRPDHFALQRRLITVRLLSALSILAVLPAYVIGAGSSGFAIAGAWALAASLLSAIVLSTTGRPLWAQMIATIGFAFGISFLALSSGGLSSPALIALALLPLEAQMVRRSAAVVAAGVIAWLALPGVWLMQSGSLNSSALAPLAAGASGVAALALAFVVPSTLVSMGRRSRASQLRRQAMAQAQLMLESVGDMVVWLDRAGRLSYANEATRRILGIAPDSLKDRGLFERVLVSDRPIFLKAIDDAAMSAEPVVAIFRATTGAGPGAAAAPEIRWLEMRARRVTTSEVESENSPAVVAVLRDETMRRAVEEEREAARAEAQRANDLKGRFLATVSHELRTPLNAIIGFSEMLSDETLLPRDSRQQRDYAQIIHTSGHHLLEIVNALLDISKIESGAMTIDHDAFDMARMVGECCDLMAIRCQEKGVTLERVIAAGLPPMMGDKRALKQVTINLLSNALKFTPEGGKVTVALVRDKNEFDLSVSDTGIGIAAEDLPNIGVPFFQAKSSYDRSHEGTGLGLSVVRGLVGLHGGVLRLESALGEGTRVCARLPIEPGAAIAGETARIVTFARPPRRQLGVAEPIRLSA